MKDNAQSPNVIHLGKKSKKEIKRYKQGVGKMFTEVQQVLAQVQSNAAPGENVQPMVVIHRKKRKKGIFASGSRMFGF